MSRREKRRATHKMLNPGNPRPPIKTGTDAELAAWILSECVAAPSGCWLWLHNTTDFGYGLIHSRKGQDRCHRVVYRGVVGDIPEGLCVLHACDAPRCCRPEHLFLGTREENIADMMAKGRNGKGAAMRRDIPRGEANHFSKLTTPAVIEIRERYKRHSRANKRLAAEFGISVAQMLRVVRGESWGHVRQGL